MILFDPQTSGGILFAISAENVLKCESEANGKKLPIWKVGEVTSTGFIEVI